MVGGTPAESSGNARSAVAVIKFGANILSQTVQRNLGRATLDLSTTSERLSSGQRINKASDDTVGTQSIHILSHRHDMFYGYFSF